MRRNDCNKYFIFILLLCQVQQHVLTRTSIPSARFLQDVSSRISNVTSELREDINAFFVGTVDTGLIPSILKVTPTLTLSRDIILKPTLGFCIPE